ncbi:hypothetical protein RGQ29_024083 [Quercus rubra]|uniref:Uncharacterized protein n=1 Tax=Quercus rubra TaxID=3512 RepID=A0AAN7IV58_QUERU|nr:hypothetical protein RGQ29_024083 [Quercus rubra]
MSFIRNFSLQGGVANDDYWSSFTRNNFINNNRNKTRNNYNNRNFSNNKDYSGKFWQQNENFHHMKTGNSHYVNPDNYAHVNPNGASAPSLKRRKFSASTWGGSGRHYVPSIAYDQAPLTCNSTIPPIRSNVEASMVTGCKRDRSHLEDEEPVFLSRDEIERCSPSRKDGIDALREAHLRYTYCSFLQNLGLHLELPQTTIGTAMVLCHRFFVRQSHASHDRFDWFEQYRERVIEAEHVILSTLNFELNVQHPYAPLTSILNKFGLSKSVLVNLALNLVSEGLRSSLWLQFKPHHIAAGAAYLAAKFLNLDLSSHQNIWQEFQTTPAIVQDVSQQLMELF